MLLTSGGVALWGVDAAVAQLAERVICNLEVTGSIPVSGFSLMDAAVAVRGWFVRLWSR